jgi:hypothetical protein
MSIEHSIWLLAVLLVANVGLGVCQDKASDTQNLSDAGTERRTKVKDRRKPGF